MSQNFTNWKSTYDVLEPIKAPQNPHRDVGILIDISDEQDKHDLNLRGSDLDNIKKSEFDLLDLYENIYVTPQHIRKRDLVETPHMIDYDGFFQKLEAGEEIDWSVNPSTSKDFPVDVCDDVDSGIKEDEKEYRSVEEPINTIILNNVVVERVLKVPKINELKYEVNQVQQKLSNLRRSNVINEGDKVNTSGIKKTDNLLFNNNQNVKELKAGTSIDRLFNKKESILEKSFNNIDLNKIHVTPIQNRSISQSFGSINNLRSDLGTLKTVTLDKKTYAKQRQVKSDMEKLGFTKGPDFYEKSIVLPQIMKRLTQRENALQENANLNRRLVLRSSKSLESQCQCNGTSKPLNETKRSEDLVQKIKPKPSKNTSKVLSGSAMPGKGLELNPIVALENCNRERLIAHRVHSAFEKFVLTGSYY